MKTYKLIILILLAPFAVTTAQAAASWLPSTDSVIVTVALVAAVVALFALLNWWRGRATPAQKQQVTEDTHAVSQLSLAESHKLLRQAHDSILKLVAMIEKKHKASVANALFAAASPKQSVYVDEKTSSKNVVVEYIDPTKGSKMEISKSDLTELLALVNIPGQNASLINAQLGAAQPYCANNKAALDLVVAASRNNDNTGTQLKAIEVWATSRLEKLAPAGQGTVVGDAGSATGGYTGPVDPNTLTKENWAFFQQHEGNYSAKIGQMFNSNPIPRDPATGVTYTQGDLTTAAQDPIIRATGLDLRSFIS